MAQNKFLVIGAAIIYVVLVVLFFAYHAEEKSESECNSYKPCVRFCCKNKTKCNDEYIRINFDTNLLHNHDDEDFDLDFKIMFGRPNCTMISKGVKNYEVTHFGLVNFENKTYYDMTEYCLEPKAGAIARLDGDVDWEIFVCQNIRHATRNFHMIMMIISVLFLLATVLVYAFLGELKSVADKSFLCFVAALTLTYASYPLLVFNFDDFEEMISSWIFFIGLFCSLLWLNVLVFDIWWTFRKFQASAADPGNRFKPYCIYGFGFLGLFLISLISEHFSLSFDLHYYDFFEFCYMTTFIDFILLVLTGIKILKMSRSTEAFDRTQFQAETERFWTYVELFIIMMISWRLEAFTWRTDERSPNSFIVADVIKCFSAVLIFVMFAVKSDVRFLLRDQFSAFKNTA